VGVPLVVAGPGVQPGGASDALVSMHDLAATFLDVAGRPPLPGMDSRSLRPLLSGATQRHRPHVRSGLDDWRMVFDGRHKLVRQIPAGASGTPPAGPSMRLFDLQDDPWETHDLAARLPEEVARLAPLLEPGT
jgi:arylsulfatase A-like enzyme